MLDMLVNTIAVPFGYTSDLSETDFQRVGDPFIITADMWTNDLRISGGWSLLPDIIQSNTPPPSPLRRALSSSFVFPDKSIKITQQDAQPNAVAESVDRSVQLSMSESQDEDLMLKGNTEGSACNSKDREDGKLCQDTKEDLCPDLPELSWRMLPLRHRTPPDICHEAIRKEEEERQAIENSGEGISIFSKTRDIGCELRKIADQFELDNAKMNQKREKEMALKLALPAAFSRCVSVSIFFLVWWRLFNKFR